MKDSEIMSELCVAKVPLFAGLSLDEMLEVAGVAKPVKAVGGQVIHPPGQNLSHLIVVHTGRVRISFVDENGNERLARVLGPGDFIGEDSFVTGNPPDHVATAIEESDLCTFQHADFKKLVSQYPGIAVQMLREVSTRLNSAEQFISELTTTPVQVRLARYLLDQPTKWVGQELSVQLPFSKKDVASFLGMAPETLSRGLSTLSRSGILRVEGNTVWVLDPARLTKAAT